MNSSSKTWNLGFEIWLFYLLTSLHISTIPEKFGHSEKIITFSNLPKNSTITFKTEKCQFYFCIMKKKLKPRRATSGN